MTAGEKLIEDFVEAVCQLSKVNRLTGIWDNRRFQECKKSATEADLPFVYKTEKLSRKNVELRAVYRTQIDVLFERLLELRSSGHADRTPLGRTPPGRTPTERG